MMLIRQGLLQLNKGIMHADGEYYIFLHVDTIITEKA